MYSNIVPCYFKKNYYYLFTKYTVVLLYLNEKTNGFEDVFILDLQEVSKKRAKSFFSFSTHSTKQSSLFDIDTIVGLYQSQCISFLNIVWWIATLYIVRVIKYDEQYQYVIDLFNYSLSSITTMPQYQLSITIPTKFTYRSFSSYICIRYQTLLNTMKKARLILYEQSLYIQEKRVLSIDCLWFPQIACYYIHINSRIKN